jgi:hypothetical protein
MILVIYNTSMRQPFINSPLYSPDKYSVKYINFTTLTNIQNEYVC